MYLVEKFELGKAALLSDVRDIVRQHNAYLELAGSGPVRFNVFVPCDRLERLAEQLRFKGCVRLCDTKLRYEPSPKDGVVPDDFYATTNLPTFVMLGDGWREVEQIRMDSCIVIKKNRAVCTLMREVKAGDMVVVGQGGIRTAVLRPLEAQEREWEFMSSTVSSERQVWVAVKRLAAEMKQIRDGGGRIVFVLGPGIVHTGGAASFCGLIEKGYVQALLTGNALAVHDIENALYGTSLGISTTTGMPVADGHRNHLRAINRMRYHGSISGAVASGELRSGIMYTLVKRRIPYVLAVSIRDDGPLPDTEMNLEIAQRRYSELLQGAHMVIMVSTMLHSIGVGNMLPATTRTICVDINHAVVSKLVDRGSTQAVGIVTDAGLFLEALDRELETLERSESGEQQGTLESVAK